MKHYKSDNEAKYQEKLHTKEDDPIDYYAMVMKQKKQEKILAVVVAILTISSLIGSYMGVSEFIKEETVLSYLILGVIGVPFASMLSGVVVLFIFKEEGPEIKKGTITFTSISFLVFVFIGNSMSVLFLIRLGTILAYFISVMIICVVFYLLFKAVKSRVRDKDLPYE